MVFIAVVKPGMLEKGKASKLLFKAWERKLVSSFLNRFGEIECLWLCHWLQNLCLYICTLEYYAYFIMWNLIIINNNIFEGIILYGKWWKYILGREKVHRISFTYWFISILHSFPISLWFLRQNYTLSQEDPRVNFNSSWLLLHP